MEFLSFSTIRFAGDQGLISVTYTKMSIVIEMFYSIQDTLKEHTFIIVSEEKKWLLQYFIGCRWQGFGGGVRVGGPTCLVSLRRMPCWTQLVPAGSATDLLQDKAEHIR